LLDRDFKNCALKSELGQLGFHRGGKTPRRLKPGGTHLGADGLLLAAEPFHVRPGPLNSAVKVVKLSQTGLGRRSM